MSDIVNSDCLPVEVIGSPAFLPDLLEYIRGHFNSSQLPLDAVIIKSILLCIISGHKHLILRTPKEDLGLVLKVVAWTLSCIFDYSTQKVKLRSYASNISPDTFLASLFLPPNHPHPPWVGARQAPVRASLGHSSGKHTSRGLGLDHYRSSSYATDPTHGHRHTHARSTSSGKYETEPKLFRGYSEPEVPLLSSSPPLRHSLTDPVPHRHAQRPEVEQGSHALGTAEAPRALVVSGLEKTSEPVQRALAQVLSDGYVRLDAPRQPGTDNGRAHGDEEGVEEKTKLPLPPGFIMVYVCHIDPKERPTIHRNLLDRFSMSHNIQLSTSIRQILQTIPLSPLSHPNPFLAQSNPNSPSTSIHSPLPQQAYSPPYFTKPLPGGQPLNASRHVNNLSTSPSIAPQIPLPAPPSKPILPLWFLELLRRYCHHAHFAPHLDLYLADLFSAVRHHPRLDGMLLTVASRKDAEDLARAARVIGTDLTGTELLRPPGHFERDVDDRESSTDDMSAQWTHPEVGTSHTHAHFHAPALSAHSPQYSKATTLTLNADETAHLLRKDASSVFTSALSHAQSDHDDAQSRHPTAQSADANPKLHFRQDSDRSDGGEDQFEVEVLDVTEADVARMMPRVVTHRLRMRDGPEEEVFASAVVGATFDNPPGVGGILGAYGVGIGIKDILVEILHNV